MREVSSKNDQEAGAEKGAGAEELFGAPQCALRCVPPARLEKKEEPKIIELRRGCEAIAAAVLGQRAVCATSRLQEAKSWKSFHAPLATTGLR